MIDSLSSNQFFFRNEWPQRRPLAFSWNCANQVQRQEDRQLAQHQQMVRHPPSRACLQAAHFWEHKAAFNFAITKLTPRMLFAGLKAPCKASTKIVKRSLPPSKSASELHYDLLCVASPDFTLITSYIQIAPICKPLWGWYSTER